LNIAIPIAVPAYRRSCGLVAVTDTSAPLATVCCDKTLPISSKINRLRGNVAFLGDTTHIRSLRDAVTPHRERGFVEDLPTNSVYSKWRYWKGGRVV
jgi:hypothetical protein